MWLECLKKMKAASGQTTAEIAAGSGIPEPTLEKLFAGATKEPKLPTMQKLVYYLGYTLEDLYKNENISEPSKNDSETLTDEEISRLSAAMSKMNEEERVRAVELVEDMAACGRYIKNDTIGMGKKEA